MLKDIEKKKRIQEWRLRILSQMKDVLKLYQFTNNKEDLEFAKELGRDSERLKGVLERMK